MRFSKFILIGLFFSLMLAACSAPLAGTVNTDHSAVPTVSSPAPAGSTASIPTPNDAPIMPPKAVAEAQKALAEKLGLQPDAIKIAAFESVEWPDACMGSAQANELCAQVITPGFRVMLSANNQTYEAHTNESGSIVRLLQDTGQPGQSPIASELTRILGQQLSVDPNQVEIASVEQVDWPDACLGFAKVDEMCAQVVTPGYKVVLKANGTLYEYHVNNDITMARNDKGDIIQLSGDPSKGQTSSVLVFKSSGHPCQEVHVSEAAVEFGVCDAPLARATISAARVEELKMLLSAYASFEASTPAGSIKFSGKGQAAPSPAEQKSISAWATLLLQEAVSGRGSAAQGLALAWHREGGFAGFCDDLVIYTSGFAQATTCKGQQPAGGSPTRLTAEQIDQLYAWLEKYQRFELEQKDAAIADAMTVRTIFEGTGTEVPEPEAKSQIMNYASQLYQSSTNK